MLRYHETRTVSWAVRLSQTQAGVERLDTHSTCTKKGRDVCCTPNRKKKKKRTLTPRRHESKGEDIFVGDTIDRRHKNRLQSALEFFRTCDHLQQTLWAAGSKLSHHDKWISFPNANLNERVCVGMDKCDQDDVTTVQV